MNDQTPDREAWWEGDYVFRPQAALPTDPSPGAQPAEVMPLRSVVCWRCGKDVNETARLCPFCHARLRPDTPEETALGRRLTLPSSSTPPLLIVVWLFLALMVVSLIGGVILRFSNAPTEKEIQSIILVVEVVDSVLVLLAVCLVRGVKPTPTVPAEGKAIAWFVGLLVLGILLGANLAYHALLKRLLPALDVEMDIPINVLTILVICVQPAIFEELFFRYLALGALRTHMGLHGAVLVSSIMFGAAHIGQPLSIPILTVIGMGLAYMRHYSGGLVLPMAMHFAHNLVVIALSQTS